MYFQNSSFMRRFLPFGRARLKPLKVMGLQTSSTSLHSLSLLQNPSAQFDRANIPSQLQSLQHGSVIPSIGAFDRCFMTLQCRSLHTSNHFLYRKGGEKESWFNKVYMKIFPEAWRIKWEEERRNIILFDFQVIFYTCSGIGILATGIPKFAPLGLAMFSWGVFRLGSNFFYIYGDKFFPSNPSAESGHGIKNWMVSNRNPIVSWTRSLLMRNRMERASSRQYVGLRATNINNPPKSSEANALYMEAIKMLHMKEHVIKNAYTCQEVDHPKSYILCANEEIETINIHFFYNGIRVTAQSRNYRENYREGSIIDFPNLHSLIIWDKDTGPNDPPRFQFSLYDYNVQTISVGTQWEEVQWDFGIKEKNY